MIEKLVKMHEEDCDANPICTALHLDEESEGEGSVELNEGASGNRKEDGNEDLIRRTAVTSWSSLWIARQKWSKSAMS